MADVTSPAEASGGGADSGAGSAITVLASRRQSLTVLRYSSFRGLFLAQTVNLLGSAIAPIALAFAVLGQPGGSATQLGLILAARALGQVAFLLFGGVLADRMPRLRLMTAANLIAFAAQGSVAGLFLAGPAPLAAVAGLAAVNGAAAALFLPAARGVVPQLIPADQLQPGNALLRLSRNGASIAGAALAGVLLAVTSPGWALACDAASFLISAALLARVSSHVTTGTSTGRPAEPPALIRDLREGWREFRARTWVWLPVAQFTMVNGCFAVIWVLGPVVARQDLGGAPAWAAVLTANAIGLVGGSLLALRLRPAHPLRVACAATFGFLPPFFLLAAAAPVWLIAASMLVNGICVDIFEVLWDTSLQRHVPPGLLSRITSYDLLGSFALGPLGLALAGPAAAAAGLAATLTGAGLLLAAASVIPLLSRAVRDLPAGPAPGTVGSAG
jgi:MFS family permease